MSKQDNISGFKEVSQSASEQRMPTVENNVYMDTAEIPKDSVYNVQKLKKKKHTGAIIAIIAAVTVLVAGTVTAVLMLNSSSGIVRAMNKTVNIMEERYENDIFRSMSGVANSDSDSYMVGVSCSDIDSAYDNSEEMDFDLYIYKDQIGNETVEMACDWGDLELDLNMYKNEEFIGVGSKSIFGDRTIYGIEPHDFSEQVDGTDFDPETGKVPLDEDTVEYIDDILEASYDTEAIEATNQELEQLIYDFFLGSEMEKSKGALPTTGEKAKIYTCVYTEEQQREFFENAEDIIQSNGGYESFWEYLSIISGETDDIYGEWEDLFEDLDYEGEMTIKYYVVEGAVAYIEIEDVCEIDGEEVVIKCNIDFDIGGDTLKIDTEIEIDDEILYIEFESTAEIKGDKSNTYWELRVSSEDEDEYIEFTGESVWDMSKDKVILEFSASDKGYEYIDLKADGTYKKEQGKSFELELDNLEILVNDETVLFMELVVSMEHGVEVPQPDDVVYILEMREDERIDFAESMMQNVEELMVALDSAYYGSDYYYDDYSDNSEDREAIVEGIQGYDYMGRTNFMGEEIYLPYGSINYGDSGFFDFSTENLYISTSCYYPYEYSSGADAVVNELEYWVGLLMEDAYATIIYDSGLIVDGDTTMQYYICDYESYIMAVAGFAEERDDCIIYTDATIYYDFITNEEYTILAEWDAIYRMPEPISTVLAVVGLYSV